MYSALGDHVYGRVPLNGFVAKVHGVHVPSKFCAENIAGLFKEHSCACCDNYVSVFTLHSIKPNSERFKQWYAGLDASQKKHKQERKKTAEEKQKNIEQIKVKWETEHSKLSDFLPAPPSKHLQETTTVNWYEDSSPGR
jgi:hypothetical protein